MFDCHLKLNNYKLNSSFISLNPICPLMFATSVNITILCLVTQTPNHRVICLRLGFLEAEPEMEILIQVVHQERALRKTLVRVWRKEKEVGNVWFQYSLVSVWCLSSGVWRTPEASWPQYSESLVASFIHFLMSGHLWLRSVLQRRRQLRAISKEYNH